MIMEPNKFDKNIKVKIEARTIAPSADAWHKLEAMMSVADKPKRRYVWWYIAASFVGLLLVSSIFFNQSISNKINTSNPVVLEQEQTNPNVVESVVNNEEDMLLRKGISSIAVNGAIRKKEMRKKSPNQIKDKDNAVVANNEKVLRVVSPTVKVIEAISTNKYTSAENLLAAVSDTKVEEIKADKSFKKASVGTSVDPNNLLSSVEKELNQSYKESALEKFNKKFNAVKTALVNRNYQE